MRVFLLLAILFLTSCRWFTDAGAPLMSFNYIKVPQGTPTFQQGFKDGCGSSTYARATVFYKAIYKHNYNAKLIGNSEYRFGYSRGYSACFGAAVSGTSGPQASFDAYLKYDTQFNMSAGDINSTWDGFFGGGIWAGDVTNSNVNFNSIMGIWQNAERGGGTVLGGNPLWAGGSQGQIFGQ
jgi:hypothetical protein